MFYITFIKNGKLEQHGYFVTEQDAISCSKDVIRIIKPDDGVCKIFKSTPETFWDETVTS